MVPRAETPHPAMTADDLPDASVVVDMAAAAEELSPRARDSDSASVQSGTPRLAEARAEGVGQGPPQSAAPPTAARLGSANENEILSPRDGSEIVHGVPLVDPATVKSVRRVIILATFGATFYVCNFNVNLIRGMYNSHDAAALWSAMSTLLIELSIPACGYCGAVYNNRQLTCCFCSCSLFVAIVASMTFIGLNVRVGELDGDCNREQNPQQKRACEAWMSNTTEKYVMATSTAVVFVLGCLAFCFGNNLFNRLTQDNGGPVPSPLVGEVISLTNPAADGQMVAAPGGATATPAPNSGTSTGGGADDNETSTSAAAAGAAATSPPASAGTTTTVGVAPADTGDNMEMDDPSGHAVPAVSATATLTITTSPAGHAVLPESRRLPVVPMPMVFASSGGSVAATAAVRGSGGGMATAAASPPADGRPGQAVAGVEV